MAWSAIRKFLSETTMTQTAWLKEIGVNSNTFGRFMSSNYKDQVSMSEASVRSEATRICRARSSHLPTF